MTESIEPIQIAEPTTPKLVPTKKLDSDLEEVNIYTKDGDPRKTAFSVGLLKRHEKAVRIWQDVGLMAKSSISDIDIARKDALWGHSIRKTNDGYERRKHFAPEHMVTVIAGSQALGQLLEEKGLLTKEDVFDVEDAAALHDAGKELEFLLVNNTFKENPTLESYKEIINVPNVHITDNEELKKIIAQFAPQLIRQEKGVRGLAAYDLAGEINKLRLKAKGVSEKTLDVQQMAGHTSCPEIESLIDTFGSQSEEEKTKTIEMSVLHYIDDVTTNPNIINPEITTDEKGNKLNALDRRCQQNEDNVKYAEFNLAWKNDPRNTTRGTTKETAFQMQRRIGHKVETFLSNLIGLTDPISLPQKIDERIKQNIISGNPKIVATNSQSNVEPLG
jgi:hypothetical protein